MNRRFKVAAVGGTFDEFHKGHRSILKKAFEVGEKVIIGLCTDDFVKKLRKPHIVDPYEIRLKSLKLFLQRNHLLERAEIIPLNDPYGPTINDEKIEVLVVSEETAPTAYRINEIRRRKGLKPLEIIVVNMVLAEDEKTISTTRIRRGEIDHEGRLLSEGRT
ncbi:phosphopantetheine adenylyltransferase [Candidatus Bathyarchaeota archaeon]|nr:MAG: phosphopantetheine adenylyltransferase [Candidatus Bathyarchaeota archaeon]